MDLKHITILALQVSIISMVFGFGLKTSASDLLYLFHRPSLLGRSLLAVFVIMPLLALALIRMFAFPPAVRIVLMSLAISPVPPLLPMKQSKAGGHVSFGLGLMAMLAVVSIVAVPAWVDILGRYLDRSFTMAPGVVAAIVLKSVLVPLAAGTVVRAELPAVADRLVKAVGLITKILLPAAIVMLLAGTLSAIWALIEPTTVLTIAIFTLAGFAIGDLLGGPNPEHSVVLGLSTACRHPAIAFSIATTNFPEQRFGALILLYLIVNVIVGIPYVMWHKSRARVLPAAR